MCLRLLSDQPRTRAELAAALVKRGVPSDAAETVLDRFDEVGLIDDAAFARAWVSSRHHGRGLARRALGQELRRKGVDSETIGEALELLDPQMEEETARALVARKLRTVHGPPEVVLRKVVGALARKGYQPGLAFRVVKEALEAAGAEAGLDPDDFSNQDIFP
jgi:regulatory protein